MKENVLNLCSNFLLIRVTFTHLQTFIHFAQDHTSRKKLELNLQLEDFKTPPTKPKTALKGHILSSSDAKMFYFIFFSLSKSAESFVD